MTLGRAAQPDEVQLPGGMWPSDGETSPLRSVRLRAVSDEDRAFLLASQDAMPVARRASELLARCTNLGDPGALSVGDREALLLNLHRLTFGETLECVLRCPACDQRMELAPRVSELLLPPYPSTKPLHVLQMMDADASYLVSFRLPVADDLDSAAAVASDDLRRAARGLLESCVHAASRDGCDIAFDDLPPVVRDALAREMLRLDPQAQVELDVRCPACDHGFDLLLDVASFLLRELDHDAARLLSEVHVLASHYGWNEGEIFAIPAARRARYIALIADRDARPRSP
jgi:hypothetical protein